MFRDSETECDWDSHVINIRDVHGRKQVEKVFHPLGTTPGYPTYRIFNECWKMPASRMDAQFPWDRWGFEKVKGSTISINVSADYSNGSWDAKVNVDIADNTIEEKYIEDLLHEVRYVKELLLNRLAFIRKGKKCTLR